MNKNCSRFAAGLVLAAASFASAQSTTSSFQPIDPLVRPTEGPGGYSFSASFDYAPDASLTSGGISTSNGLGLSVSGSYNLTSVWSVFGRGRVGANLSQQLGEKGASGLQSFSVSAPTLGSEYRFGGTFAPTLSAEVSLPLFGQLWAAAAGVSASLLRDPLIVDSSLSYRYQVAGQDTGAVQTISAGLGVGFVVNESFTLRGDVNQSWTIGRIALPSTDLGASLSYKLDERQYLRTSLNATVLGGELRPRLGLGYVFRR